jgi:hypothetical protein
MGILLSFRMLPLKGKLVWNHLEMTVRETKVPWSAAKQTKLSRRV